jgi:hypothetical protein
MKDYSDYPPEYLAWRWREWVFMATGTAIIRAQYVEHVLKAICQLMNTRGSRLSTDDFLSGDASRTRQTLGMIERELRNTKIFDPQFSERLQEFTRRRNRIVHGLFADSLNAKGAIEIDSPIAQEYVKECEWLIQEAPRLVEIGFGIFRVLGNLIRPDHPEYAELVADLQKFDEYYEAGLGTIAPELRTSIDDGTFGL